MAARRSLSPVPPAQPYDDRDVALALRIRQLTLGLWGLRQNMREEDPPRHVVSQRIEALLDLARDALKEADDLEQARQGREPA